MDVKSINAQLKQQIQTLAAAHQCKFNEVIAKIFCTPNPYPTSMMDGHLATFQLFAGGRYIRDLDLQSEILGIKFVDSMGKVPQAHFFLARLQGHLADKHQALDSEVNVRVCGLSATDASPRWMLYLGNTYKGELDIDATVKEVLGGLFG